MINQPITDWTDTLFHKLQVLHIKTGNVYKVVNVIMDCTNSHDWGFVVIYERDGIPFSRILEEFMVKFKPTN